MSIDLAKMICDYGVEFKHLEYFLQDGRLVRPFMVDSDDLHEPNGLDPDPVIVEVVYYNCGY